MKSTFESQRQDSLKSRWQDRRFANNINTSRFPSGLDDDDALVSSVVPPVTVVLEGRSICQHISLHNHASYHSLAKALRQMFVEGNDDGSENDVDLSNAVPDHLTAYEDMENDLLLAGDLNWKILYVWLRELGYCQRRGIQGREEEGHSLYGFGFGVGMF